MPPRFKLQSVLDYRRWREETAQQQFAAAAAREAELLAQLTRGQTALDALHLAFEASQQEGLPPHEITLHREHLRAQMTRLEELAREWEGARREVEAGRALLAERTREKKLLEKVKEKHHARALVEAQQRENAVLDQIALQQYQR